MKKITNKFKLNGKMRSASLISMAVVVLVAALVGAYSLKGASAASATLYMSPLTASYTVGQTITVAIRENSGTEGVNYVVADFTYPQADLTFSSIDGSTGSFTTDANSSGGNGSVSIEKGSQSSVTGDKLVANVTFIVTAAGSAQLNFDANCVGTNDTNCSSVIDSTTYTNISSGTTGASYTLSAPAVTTPPAGGGGSGSGSTGSSSSPKSSTSTAPKSVGPSTSITPSGSLTPIVTPNNSSVAVTTPVSVQPATIQLQGVSEIQYYLNGKLIYTAKIPPYTYMVNTTKLLDGTYTLVTKTIYNNGQPSTISTATLHVDNPLSVTQAWLFFKKYLLIPTLIIVAIVAIFIGYKTYRNRKNPFGPDNHHIGGGTVETKPYIKQPEAPVIRPSIIG